MRIPLYPRRRSPFLGMLYLLGLSAIAAMLGAWWGGRRENDADLASCERALARDGAPAAVATCRRLLLSDELVRAGAMLARAHHEAGEGDAVLAWAAVLGDHPEAGSVWRLSGEVHKARDNTALARACYQRALRIDRDAGRHGDAFDDAYSLYRSYWRSSDYREALQYAEVALEEARRAGDERAEQTVFLAIFTVLYDIGDLPRAETALRLVAPRVTRGDGDAWLYTRFNEGLLRQARAELEAASTAYEDVLVSAPPGHTLLPSVLLNLVEVMLALGQPGAAGAYLDQVLGLPETVRPSRRTLLYYGALVARARGDFAEAEGMLRETLLHDPPLDWAWQLHHALGTVLEAQGYLDAASEAHGRAIDTVEELRSSLGIDDLKDWMLAEKRAPYESLFTLEANRGAVVEALAVAERARERTFLDATVLATSPGDATGLPAASERLEVLRTLLPSLRASPVVAPHPIDEVLEAVRDLDIVMYFQAGERVWLLTAGALAPRLQALALPAPRIRELVNRLIAQPDDRDVAQALGEALVPDEAWLGPPGNTLHVIADGVVSEVPFAALRVGDRYLVERHAIAYVPSLNALAVLARQAHEPYGPAVVLGDPRDDLPGARAEAVAVGALLRVQPFTGRAARAEILRQAAQADILHLATHAGVGSRGAWLELADRRLDAATLLSWGLRPRLAVLASCTSAARSGTSLWGSVAGAFLAAGSRNVLATWWSVDDEVTRRFLLSFYQGGGAADPAGALARTQRAFAARGEPPSVWAPFLLLGAADRKR